jgi:hypothetical protein
MVEEEFHALIGRGHLGGLLNKFTRVCDNNNNREDSKYRPVHPSSPSSICAHHLNLLRLHGLNCEVSTRCRLGNMHKKTKKKKHKRGGKESQGSLIPIIIDKILCIHLAQ